MSFGTEEFGCARGGVGVAEGESDTEGSKHLGQHHGRNAHGHDGFGTVVSVEDGFLDIGADLHARHIESVGREVAGGTHTAGQRQGVELGGVVFGEGFDVAAGYAGGFGEEVTLGAVLVAGEVVDHVEDAFGREALIVPIAAVDGQHEREGFLKLAAVAVAAAREDDCNVHKPKINSILSISFMFLRLLSVATASSPLLFSSMCCCTMMKASYCWQ